MRKIIVIIALVIGFFGFSQEKSSVEFKFDLRFNNAKAEFRKKIKGVKYPLSTIALFRISSAELYEGIVLPVSKYVSFTPSAGIEYLYDEQEFKPRLRGTLRISSNRFWVVVHYGSDWGSHDVTTKIKYGLIGDRLQIGIATINEDVGPLLCTKMRIDGKKFYTYISFVDSSPRFGLKINIDEWGWIQDLNPFHKK